MNFYGRGYPTKETIINIMATGGYYQYGHHSLWTSFEEMGAALVKFSINWKDVLPVEYDEQRCLVCEEVKDFRRHDIPELGYLCSDGCLLNIWYLVLRTLKYKNKGLLDVLYNIPN